MFETPLTVIGTIVTDPQRRRVGDQELVKFRVASNSRRRTGEGTWEPGNSLFLTVNCWGKLATGVGGSLAKGDAVIVQGQVYTSEYDDRDGNRRSSVELRANAVGPDLSRYIAKIEKHGQAGNRALAADQEAADSADIADSVADGDESESDEAAQNGREPLPLSA